MTTELVPAGGRVVVVGAGHAGGTFVALLRQAGYLGELAVVGAEPDLPYHRPPLSKGFLADIDAHWLREPSFYDEQNVTMTLDESVMSIDRAGRTVHTSTGRTRGYDVLVLATGARPRVLSVPGAALDGVLTLRTLSDARRLRRAVSGRGPLAVVGGGYVGLEVAAVARSHGARVTVIEREERVLARVASPKLSAILADHHRSRGTAVLTGTQVVAFEGDGEQRLRAVFLEDGSRVEAGTAVVGVGAVPCDELAAASGLACAGGVVVDGGARTSDPSVLAIGDVTVRPGRRGSGRMRFESIPSAVEQAKQAVATVMGRPPVTADVPWFWSDQFDLKLKIAGVACAPYETVLRGDPASGRFALFHHHHGDLLAVESANSPADFMIGKRLLAGDRPVDPVLLADPAIQLRELAVA